MITATFLDGLHRYEDDVSGVEVVLERFSERKDGLTAEITVRSQLYDARLLHHGRLNLVSTSGKSALVKALQGCGILDGFDMGFLVEHVTYKSLQRWRQGDPTVDLREVDGHERPRWILEPFIERSGGNILFGDGGSGKSTLAMACAVTIAGACDVVGSVSSEPVPVMVLDWEADEYAAAERINAICAGMNLTEKPEIYYRRATSSLAESAPNIRREIAGLEIELVIIDSLGAARGGDPESAETTIKLFNAARSLGVPWLGIDHVPKNLKNPTRPFGSTYTHNLARLTWAVEKVQEEGSDNLVLALTNYKSNNGRLHRRLAYRLAFEHEGQDDELAAITIARTDAMSVPELVEKMPTKQRILVTLKSGKLATRDVADALDISEVQARVRLNELAKAGRVVRIGQEWGLAAHE